MAFDSAPNQVCWSFDALRQPSDLEGCDRGFECNGDITPADNSHTPLFALYSDKQFFAQDVQLNGACADQARSCWQFQSILMIWQVFHLLY
jgi:hypothetical protein